MLPRIKTKTNLIAPCLKKNALIRLLLDDAYIPGWLFILKKHFVESKGMLFYTCLTYFPLFLVFQSYEKRKKWHFSEHPVGPFQPTV